MKKFVMAVALLAASFAGSLPLAAHATVFSGFTGPFAPGTFASTFTGNVSGATTTISPTQLTLVGADDPFVKGCTGAISGYAGPCQVTVSHGGVGSSDTISFHWTYSTADIYAGYDLFGVIADGVATVLSDPGAALMQSGNYSFTSTSSFGFFINCTDCVGGAATASVSAFQVGAVPEPSTVALIFLGAALIATALRGRGRGSR